MGKPAQNRSLHKLHMFPMLPKTGMYYIRWKNLKREKDENDKATDEDNKTDNERRILPPNMSTKIMIEFTRNYEKPSRENFDRAVAELFKKGADFVLSTGLNGQDPTYSPVFWHEPKQRTFLETVSDKTVSRLAAKMLEAREAGLKTKSGKTSSKTAKAIDLFNEAVQIASVTSCGVQALMTDAYPEKVNFSMASFTNMADQFKNNDDTDDLSETDDETTDDDEEPTDDEAPAVKRVKLYKPLATDGEAGPSSALGLGTAPLAIRPSTPEGLDGKNKADTKEPAMLPTSSGEADDDVGPEISDEWIGQIAANLEEAFFKGKPDADYDALLARHDPADDWELDLDMDD